MKRGHLIIFIGAIIVGIGIIYYVQKKRPSLTLAALPLSAEAPSAAQLTAAGLIPTNISAVPTILGDITSTAIESSKSVEPAGFIG